MKLIIDQNLPRSLVALLEPHFPGTVHVKQIQFDQKDDTDLWSYAKENRFTILSKDKDFEQWTLVRGTPPKVIWLRMGNSSSSEMAALVTRELVAIKHFLEHPNRSLLILEP